MAKVPTVKDLQKKHKEWTKAVKAFQTKMDAYKKAKAQLKKEGETNFSALDSWMSVFRTHIPDMKRELLRLAKLTSDLEAHQKSAGPRAKLPKKLEADIADCLDSLQGLNDHLSGLPPVPVPKSLAPPDMKMVDYAERSISDYKATVSKTKKKVAGLTAYAKQSQLLHEELKTIRIAMRWIDMDQKKLPKAVSNLEKAIKDARKLEAERQNAMKTGKPFTKRKALDDAIKSIRNFKGACGEHSAKLNRVPDAATLQKRGKKALFENLSSYHEG